MKPIEWPILACFFVLFSTVFLIYILAPFDNKELTGCYNELAARGLGPDLHLCAYSAGILVGIWADFGVYVPKIGVVLFELCLVWLILSIYSISKTITPMSKKKYFILILISVFFLLYFIPKGDVYDGKVLFATFELQKQNEFHENLFTELIIEEQFAQMRLDRALQIIPEQEGLKTNIVFRILEIEFRRPTFFVNLIVVLLISILTSGLFYYWFFGTNQKSSALCRASLVWGILCYVFIFIHVLYGLLMALAAIICGSISLFKIYEKPNSVGKKLAISGIVLGILWFVLVFALPF